MMEQLTLLMRILYIKNTYAHHCATPEHTIEARLYGLNLSTTAAHKTNADKPQGASFGTSVTVP
jgi:hypothetical protein